MIRKFYIAAALLVALTGCKNDTTPTPINEDSAAQKPATAVTDTATEKADENENIAPKDGEVLLRLNYPKGFSQELNYDVDTRSNAMTGKVGVTIVYTVTDTVNSTYTFGGAITGMKMVSETQGQKINYNSAKKLPANAGAIEQGIDKQYKEIAGKQLTFELSNKGGVVKEMQFAGSTNKESLPFDMATYQVEFPAKPVAVGSSWTTKTADKQVGGMRTTTYTVKEINDTQVILTVRSILPAPKMQGAKESVFNGSYTLDRATGMLVKGSLNGTIEALGGSVTMTFSGKKK